MDSFVNYCQPFTVKKMSSGMSSRSTTTAATLSLLENAPHTFNQGSDLSMPVMVPAATVAAAMRNAQDFGRSGSLWSNVTQPLILSMLISFLQCW